MAGVIICVCFVGGVLDGQQRELSEDPECPLKTYSVPLYDGEHFLGTNKFAVYRRQDETTFVLDTMS